MQNELERIVERFYRIHWRLRLRSPTTPAEREEWGSLKEELEKVYEQSKKEDKGDGEGQNRTVLLAAQDKVHGMWAPLHRLLRLRGLAEQWYHTRTSRG